MRCGADISAAPSPTLSRNTRSRRRLRLPTQLSTAAAVLRASTSKGGNTALIVILVAVGAVVLVPIVLIIAAIAIPNLLRARISANESSAVQSVRTINTAAVAYQAQFNHYPEGLASMGSPVAE